MNSSMGWTTVRQSLTRSGFTLFLKAIVNSTENELLIVIITIIITVKTIIVISQTFFFDFTCSIDG